MAKDLNRVMLTGRLGRDVELRATPNSGTMVATFSVASSRNVKDGAGWKEQTEWFRVVAWDKLAETCSKFLRKGSHIYIEGRLQTREWTDKEGQKRSTTEVIATDMLMLDKKSQGGGNDDDDWGAPSSPKASSNPFGDTEEMDPEDIPF